MKRQQSKPLVKDEEMKVRVLSANVNKPVVAKPRAATRPKSSSLSKMQNTSWAERGARIEQLEAQMKIEHDQEVRQRSHLKSEIKKRPVNPDLKMDEFYKIMGEFYDGAPRHKSPTKRLMEHKAAAWRHKEQL